MAKPLAVTLAVAALVLGAAPAGPASAAAGSAGWSVQASPNPAGMVFSELDAVACPQSSTCLAVGFSFAHTAGHTVPLAEQWNGSAWTLQAIHTLPTAGRTFLDGISCASADSCIAVGFAVTSNAPYMAALAEAWNGSRWTIQAVPQPGSGGAVFEGISCPAVSSCLAVGGFLPTQGANEQPMAQRWNGSRWTVVSAPNPQPNEYGSALDAVSCTAASACTGVGSYYVRELSDFVFAARWNGSTWTLQHQPNPGVQKLDTDNGVSCPSPSSCTSAGYWTTFSAAFQAPLAESWNGRSWTQQRTPQPARNHLLTLNGISCASVASCIAVGNWSPVAGGGVPTYSLAEQWNGSSWALQHVPSPAGTNVASLNAIDCRSTTQCVAVGNYAAKTAGVTLVERYSG